MTAILTATIGVLSAWQGFWPLSDQNRKLKRIVFMTIVALTGILLYTQIKQEERTQLALLGDATKPPYYDVRNIDKGVGEELIANDSGYSHHAVNIRLSIVGKPESETRGFRFKPIGTEIVPYGISFQGTHAGLENQMPMNIEVYILSRAGKFYEQFMMRQTKSGQFVRALRVFSLKPNASITKPVLQVIDDHFPDKEAGLDWSPLSSPASVSF